MRKKQQLIKKMCIKVKSIVVFHIILICIYGGYHMTEKIYYLDLFAGGGGLSEGFIRAGFTPVAHVEINRAAANTLRTRAAYHWLNKKGKTNKYISYIKGDISRSDLYGAVPEKTISSVINAEIGQENLLYIFARIDSLLNGKKLDLIVGGPPCQAYSLVGRSRDKNRMKGDKRNYLYTFYAEFLKRYNPRYFVFENVTGLLSAKDQDGTLYFDKMRVLFREVGYETEYKMLSANEYGVLQKRKRIILVGKNGNKTGFYPEPLKWQTDAKVDEVLQNLPFLRAGSGSVKPCNLSEYKGEYLHQAGILSEEIPVTFHIARPHTEQDKEIYRIAVEKWNKKRERLNYNDLPEKLKSHRNRNSFTDRFKVVAGDLHFSHTVVAHISRDGHYYIHPDLNQNRSLTPREVARLQTFPDDYFFESISDEAARTSAYRQIGNAVPVLLAEKIAERLLEVW